jgi:hypothetical protein
VTAGEFRSASTAGSRVIVILASMPSACEDCLSPARRALGLAQSYVLCAP